MKQEVNLYLELPQRGAVALSFDHILRISKLFALFLLAIFVLFLLNNFWLSWKLKKENSLQQQTVDRLVAYKKRLEKSPDELQKGKLISLLNDELQVKTQVVNALRMQALSNISGFSSFLQGLSEHISTGVSLSKISLIQGGKIITLNGDALHTKNVLNFLKNLTTAPVFSEHTFELTQLDQPVVGNKTVTFVLSAKGAKL